MAKILVNDLTYYYEVQKMGLDNTLLAQEFSTLSGGEKICMMIIALFNQLRKTLVEQNITVVFVEHNEDFGESVATKVLEI